MPADQPPLEGLDHVAIVVADTRRALEYFSDALGLPVTHSEELDEPRLRLTYLDAGNAYIQLIEPLSADSQIATWLTENGEGLHHVCFASKDPLVAAATLTTDPKSKPIAGSGRGRLSAFVPGPAQHGVRIEFTEHL